jgi:hypothetical protein
MRLYYDELRERFRSAFGQTTSHLNVCFGSNRTENQFGTHPLAVRYWRVIWDGFIRLHSMTVTRDGLLGEVKESRHLHLRRRVAL